jgi:hypothetical protein
MALQPCPECGGRVSDKATACPHCGYVLQSIGQQVGSALWRTFIWLVIAYAIVTLVVVLVTLWATRA